MSKISTLFVLLLTSFVAAAQPEVHVKGNGYDIFDAAATWPDSTGQAFGVLQANVDSVSKSYWIYNTGNAPLTLSNFRVTAVYNTQFNITPPTSLVVVAGDSVFFTVEYKPIAAGTHGRTTGGSGVCVAAFDSDDADEPTYDFRISGAATTDPAFDCSTGRMFFSHRDGGGTTDLKEWHYATQPPTLSTVSNALGWGYDGMGMNPNDNYIYAMRYNGGSRNQLWAFSSKGLATFCGYVSGGGITSGMAAHAGGGAMDNNDNLYTLHNADATTSLNKINVKSQQATLITLSSPVHARSAIYNPTDGLLYAMSAGATNDGLVSIDPATGNVTLIGGDGDLTHAAMFRSTDGSVYMMTQTYTMYTVDLTTGAITQVADNPGWGDGTWVDGCACGNVALDADLAITKTDNRPSYVPGALQNYTISVTNNGPHGAYQAAVQDLVPTGITPANMSWYSTTYGTATSRFTSGTGALNDTIDLGVGDSIVYTVRIIVDNGFTGNLTNTATVTAPSFLTDPNAANNTATDVDTPVGSATEQCNNGFDDDGDGLVDCFDGDCAGNAVCSSHYTNGVHSPCPDTPDVALFSMQEQYRRTNVVSDGYCTPIVGDLEGDGIPEIVVHTMNAISGASWTNGSNATIRVLNGQTGAVKHSRTVPRIHYFTHSTSIADVDNDGDGEIYVVSGDQRLRGFDHTLTALPGFTTNVIGQGGQPIWDVQKAAGVQFADFDQDGQTELFIGNQVFNALTGAILAEPPTKANANNWPKGSQSGGDYIPSAADVLPDSFCPTCSGLEIVAGNTIYAVDLTNPTANAAITIAAQMTPTATYGDGFTSIADWDGDNSLDVIVTTYTGGASQIYIWNPRTQALVTQDQLGNAMPAGLTTVLAGNAAGRTTVADFDGDGINELALVSRNSLLMFESDLSLKWQRTTADESRLTSATAFDFEGDGNVEVIYRDEDWLRIMDGVTGVTKDSLACASGTRVEMPVVADVDADGQAEIAVTCGNDLVVYEADQTPWMPTRKVWNTFSYSPAWVNDDLTIPAHRQNKATIPRNDIYAAQAPITDPSGNLIYPALPDFVVTVDSSTVGSCNDDSTAVHVTICNDDAPSLKYDYPLSFYNGDPNAGGTLLGTRWVTAANTTFTRDSCYYFTFNTANQPTDLYVIPNDSGTGTFGYPTTHIQECDSNNNIGNREVGCAIDAGVTKDDGQLSYIPGGPVTYTIVAKNEGPNFTGGVVSDPLPTGVSAGDVTWTATTYGGATTKAVGTMNGALQDTVDITGGDSVVYIVTIATPETLVGDLVNTVTITVTGDTITTNNTATDTDTVDCTFAISGGVNSRNAGWTELGTVRSGLTYNFGTSGGFKTFTASNGPESGNVISTVIFNTGTNQHVSLTKNKYNPANSWLQTVGIYDNTPHGWTGLSGVAPENAPILGFMAFVDQNGNGTFDSGVEEYIRDINSLSVTPSTTGQLYMAFYDDGPYNDNSGSLTINASITASTVNLGNDTTFCSGNSVTLDAENAGATYLWNTGATSQTIVAGATGQYDVTVNTGGGCLLRDTMNVTVDTVTVSLGNDTSFCAGDSITLDAGNPGDAYLWSTGETSQTIVAKAVGQYFVRVTNGDGCIGRDTMNITSLTALPVVNLGNDTTICTGDSLTLDAENAGATYLWNDASTAQTLVAKSVGQYFVEVNAGGCIGMDTMEITGLNPLPIVSLGNDTMICTGGSLTLDAENAGATYLWNDASSGQTLVAQNVGQYFVTVTNGSGCVGRDTTSITGLHSLPVVNLGNDTSICSGSPLVLDAENAGSTYVWNDASTNQTLNASAIGQYFVEVTNGFGCIGRDTMNITGFSSGAPINLGNDTSICAGTSITLDAGAGVFTYLWNDGSTGQTLEVSAAGQYFVEVTNDGGCISRDTLNINSINPLPVINLPATTSACEGTPFVLDAENAGSTFLWSDGSTGQTLSLATDGQFHVTITDANGCISSDTTQFSLLTVPTLNLGPDPSTICNGSTLTLDAQNVGATYLWQDGSTHQTFDVTTLGKYYVRVTNGDGCVASDTINVNAFSSNLAVNIGPDTSICAGASLTLNANNVGSTYLWNDGSTAQTLNITSVGQYYVDVTDPNGCSGSDTMNLTAIRTNPILNLGNDTSVCAGNTVTLDAENAGSQYLWHNASTQQTLVAGTTGDYHVLVTDGFGCISRDTIYLKVNALPEVLVNDVEICDGDGAANFTATSDTSVFSYQWSGLGTGTAQSTTGTTAGVYTVTIVDLNGCMDQGSGTLTANSLPVVTVNDAAICNGDPASTFTATVDNAVNTYTWSGQASGSGQSVMGSTAGQYTVDVEDVNGCRGTATGTLTVNELPIVTLNGGNICPSTLFTLTPIVTTTQNPPTYLWSTGETSPTVQKSAGTYSVVVTDAAGCEGSAIASIVESPNLTVVIPGPISICEGMDTLLQSNYLAVDGYTFNWSYNSAATGDITESIRVSQAGTYGLFVDRGGCSGATTVEVIISSPPALNLGNDTSICTGASLTLDAGNGGTQYQWSDGSTAQTLAVNAAGEYHVTMTNSDGCIARDTMQLLGLLALPTVTVNDVQACPGSAASVFTATSATATKYLWSSNGSGTAQTTSGNTAGDYTVLVTDANGCENSGTGSLSYLSNPSVIVADRTVCPGTSGYYLFADAPTATSYTWSGNGVSGSNDTLYVAEEGTYTITVSDGNCSNTTTGTLSYFGQASIDLGPDQTVCEGDVTSVSAEPFTDVLWNDGSTASTLMVDKTSTVDVLVTNSGGCEARDTVVINFVSAAPLTSLGNDTTICTKTGGSVLLEVKEIFKTIEWQDGSQANNYVAEEEGEYKVIVTDDNGCQNRDSIAIKDSCGTITITIPNLFKPDGPGPEDPLRPVEDPEVLKSLVTVIDFTVFNRWGIKMHYSEGVLPYWTGFDMNRSKPCPTGVYFWILRYEDAEGELQILNGFTQLLRPK